MRKFLLCPLSALALLLIVHNAHGQSSPGFVDGTVLTAPALNGAFQTKQDADADLTALAGVSTTGMLTRTGPAAVTTRTIAGTANEITVVNGDGVGGGPTVSLPASLIFTGKTVTGGSFTSSTIVAPTLSGTPQLGSPSAWQNALGLGGLISSITALNSSQAAALGFAVVNGITAGDGDGGIFYWNAASTATPDGENIFQLNGGGTGRWIRSSTMNVAMSGGARQRLWTFDYGLDNKVWEEVASTDTTLLFSAMKDDLSQRVDWLQVNRTNDWSTPTAWGRGIAPNGMKVIQDVVVTGQNGLLIGNLEGGGYDVTESSLRFSNAYDIPTNGAQSGMAAMGPDGSLVIYGRSEAPEAIRFVQNGGLSTAVTAVANNGAGYARLTVGSTVGFVNGGIAYIAGVTGTPLANGAQVITVIDGTHVDLLGGNVTNAATGLPYALPPVTYVAGGVSAVYAAMQDGATESGRFAPNKFFGIGPFNAYNGAVYTPDRRLSVFSTDASENILGVLKAAATTSFLEFEASGTANRPKIGANANDLVFRVSNNAALDGGVRSTGVVYAGTSFQQPSYTTASLPSATLQGQTIYVTDDTYGPTIAVSNGTNWRRPNGSQVSSTYFGSFYNVSATVNFNAGNTDTAIPVLLPSGITRYRVVAVEISGASGTLTTATAGVFTAAGGGGVAVVTGGSAITVSTGAEDTNNNTQSMNVNNGSTQSYTGSTLYFRVATPQGVAATGKVTIVIHPLS